MKYFATYFLGATSIDAFSLRDNAWRSLAAMSSRRLQFGAVVVDKKLIVAGGRDGLKTLNTVECFDFSTLTWSTLPPMNVHRHGLGADARKFAKLMCNLFHLFIIKLVNTLIFLLRSGSIRWTFICCWWSRWLEFP